MIDPRHITPLLSGMTVRRQIGKGPNGSVYLVTKAPDHKKMAVKHISIPATDSKTKALIYSGAVQNEREAQRYFSNLVADYKSELLLTNKVQNAANLHRYRGYQVDQKMLGVGYDLYLLADYDRNLVDFLSEPITKVNAVNLGIDLASALEQLRSENLLHKDVHPGNVFVIAGQHFALGDLGIAELSDIRYSAMPDSMITAFSAPEVLAADATLSSTMDIYSVGVILYMIYNGNDLPLDAEGHFKNSAAEELEAPAYADLAMSEIILKACAYAPEDRYQTPTELKEALVLYAQRGDVSDEYLVPQPEPEPEEEAEPVAEAIPVVPVTEDTDADSAAEEAPAFEAPDEAAAEAEAAPTEAPEEVEAFEPVDEAASAEAEAPDAVSGDTKVVPTIPQEVLAAAEAAAVATPKAPVTPPDLLIRPNAVPKETIGALGTLDQDQMIMPASGELSVEAFLSSFKKKNGVAIYSMDDSGNLTAIPEFTITETDSEEFIDSADSEDTAEQESFSAEAEPQETPIGTIPAGIQLPAEVLMEDPVVPEITQSEIDAATTENMNTENSQNIDDLISAVSAHINTEIPAEPQAAAAIPQSSVAEAAPESDVVAPPSLNIPGLEQPAAPVSYTPDYDLTVEDEDDEDEEVDEDDDDEDEESGSGAWKKVLITIIVLLVLAGGAFAFYTFKTDTIEAVGAEAVSSTSIVVSADTLNDSSMNVICSTPAGEVATAPLTDGQATFTDLSPNTTYSFTLASADGKVLIGSKTTSTKTNQMTNLNGFSVISYSAVSATLALTGTGPQPEYWVLTLSTDSGEERTVEVTGTQFEVTDLTPETTYTVTIEKGDGDILGGTTTCSFTTQEYTVLSSFGETSLTTDSMSLAWSYSGTTPDVWTLTCDGDDGSTFSQEISGTEYTVENLNAGVTYTLSLSTPSIYPAEINTIEVAIPSITITEVTSEVNEDGEVQVDWTYTGDTTPDVWHLSYTYADDVAPTEITSTTNSIVLPDLIPDTTYRITVTGADNLSVGGDGATTCTSAKAEDFTKYGCTDPKLTLYVLEDNEDGLSNSSTTFTTEEHVAFALEVNYEESEDDKSVSTLYVIRNSDGIPVHVYESSRTWTGTWTIARHTGDLPDTLETPGTYTLEVYFDGDFMDSQEFTVE